MRRGTVSAATAVMLAVSVTLAGCSSGKDTKEAASKPAAPPEPTVFPVVDVPPAQVHRVAVEGDGKAVALIRSSSATWLAEPPTPDTTVSLMAESEDEILPLLAFRRLDADPHSAEYGLAQPGLVVRIQNAAGDEQAVAIGAVTFSGAGSYARRESDPGHVYLLVRKTVDDLRSLLRGERVNTPRSAEETKVLSESAADDADPEEVTNPWLAQVLDEEAHR
jgi:hypothetical protein